MFYIFYYLYKKINITNGQIRNLKSKKQNFQWNRGSIVWFYSLEFICRIC